MGERWTSWLFTVRYSYSLQLRISNLRILALTHLFSSPFSLVLFPSEMRFMRPCSLFDTYLSFDSIHSQWLLEFSWPLQNYLESGGEISTWTEDRDESHAELSCWLLHRAITTFCVCHSSSYHVWSLGTSSMAPLAWWWHHRGQGDAKEPEESGHCRLKLQQVMSKQPSFRVSYHSSHPKPRKFSGRAQEAGVRLPTCWRGRCSGQWAWKGWNTAVHKTAKISILWPILANG